MSSQDPKMNKPLDRRSFLAGGALLGAGMISQLTGCAAYAKPETPGKILNSNRPDAEYPFIDPENFIMSACLMCNTGCGIKAKSQDGVVTKIDGNPYNPWTLFPHLGPSTSVDAAAPVDGALCPKGQAGLQTVYDPHRIRKVLKRAGKRGENKWVSIDFAQAIKEICEGGKLFSHVPGEENRDVEGLRGLMALRDTKIAAAMKKDIDAIWKEKDRNQKSELVKAFQERHREHLHLLIDPAHPDFGPRNNQILVNWGRLKGGRGDLYQRWAAAMGTVNAHGHTTVCQGSLYFTCKAISEQYQSDGSFKEGKKFYFQANTEHSRFVLFVGANLFEANYGPTNRTVRLTDNLVKGRTRIAVVDPRFSKLASKAWKWLPIKPATDAALAMALTRWIFDEGAYQKTLLSAANMAAAKSLGETVFTNASWLVNTETGKFVRAADAGVGRGQDLVVMVEGRPVAVDPNDENRAVFGDLLVDGRLANGTPVKSSLQYIYDASHQRTLDEWAKETNLRLEDIVAVARELTSHGRNVAIDVHRGVAQHTNGFYNVLAWETLNMLLGNHNVKGGMVKGTTWDYAGKSGLFDLKAHPGKVDAFGVSSIRHGIDYEKTTLFEGYPAKRNWYPLSSDIYQEIVPSIEDAYPYPIKALITYMGSLSYALPAGHTTMSTLADTRKLPLFIASDILIGTTSILADYIFPDTSYLERWEFQGTHMNVVDKVQPVRQPVIAPIPEMVKVYGRETAISLEALILAVAEHLDLPGFGGNAFGDGLHFTHPDEFYLRGVANLAQGEKPGGAQRVPAADEREISILRGSRRHLPPSVFDETRWRKIVGDEMWPHVVHVLNRGGRFEDATAAYRGEYIAHPYKGLLNLYQEKTAKTIHSGTGKKHLGYAHYQAILNYHGQSVEPLRENYPLRLLTHRTVTQTKSRTISSPWLRGPMPENAILLHPSDAKKMGLRDDQVVRVVSATNPEGKIPVNHENNSTTGKVKLTQTVAPGVISFALGFGHWATGAADTVIDGQLIKADPDRKSGLHANAAMWSDATLRNNTCLIDPVGGSVSFYDTSVTLIPV